MYRSAPSAIGRFGLCVTLLCAIPISILPCRNSLIDLIDQCTKGSVPSTDSQIYSVTQEDETKLFPLLHKDRWT